MNRKDRRRLWSDAAQQVINIGVEAALGNVAEHWPRAQPHRCLGRGKKTVGGGHDLDLSGAAKLLPGAKPDFQRHRRRQQRIGARGHTHDMLATEVRAQLLLKRGHFWTHHVTTRAKDLRHRSIHIATNLLILRRKIDKRDSHNRASIGRQGGAWQRILDQPAILLHKHPATRRRGPAKQASQSRLCQMT